MAKTMSSRRGRGARPGRVGQAQRVGSHAIGWRERVAPPAAPDGGAGPGFFRSALPDGVREIDGRFDRFAPTRATNDGAEAPRPANPPPATEARKLGSLKMVQSGVADVAINGRIRADGTGGPARGAHTTFDIPRWTGPRLDYREDAVHAIERKFTWRGTLTIQTRYGAGANARSLACYGRGTTTADVQNRDITLGFHESCHQSDYVAYLRANPLPEPPEIELGMTREAAEEAVHEFSKALDRYQQAMADASRMSTDEVGRRESEVASLGCYVHQLP